MDLQSSDLSVATSNDGNPNIWVVYALSAALCFTICNEAISEITSKVGPACIFYFSLGSILTSAAYHLFFSFKNYRLNGVFWNNQNIIINGKFS